METLPAKERRTFLISGAGIAGLACALFVARAGYRVEIFERAKAHSPIGAGLQLSPNAMHVLAALELDRQVKTAAIAPTHIDVYAGVSGAPITQIPLGTDIVRQYGQPYLVIHRADLQKILLSACQSEPDIQIRMGVNVRDAVHHPNGISLLADDKSGTKNYRGAALIGADGVNSVIRNECFDTKPATSTALTALRAMLPTSKLPRKLQDSAITMWLGSDAHVVMYPVRANQYHNVVISLKNTIFERIKSENISGQDIAGLMPTWNEDFTSLFDINAQWTSWPLFSAPKLSRWQEGCIVLTGDAAHAMSPHAAQGAAMALEDAAVLGWAVTRENSLSDAFQLYQKQRLSRVNSTRRLAQNNQMIFQLPKHLATARDLAMRTFGGKAILKRQHWLYKWQPPSPSDRAIS